MTSETWIIGGSENEKRAIGARVRRSVASLGHGHVEALVENRRARPVVMSAHAWSGEQFSDHDLRETIQKTLNG
jgi:hypothetical protein